MPLLGASCTKICAAASGNLNDSADVPTQDQEKLAALGAVIRRLREQDAISQEELADRAGLSRNTVSNIERGVFAPSFLAVAGLAAAFGKTLSELVRAYEERLAS